MASIDMVRHQRGDRFAQKCLALSKGWRSFRHVMMEGFALTHCRADLDPSVVFD
jgi:hypothetical protein